MFITLQSTGRGRLKGGGADAQGRRQAAPPQTAARRRLSPQQATQQPMVSSVSQPAHLLVSPTFSPSSEKYV